MEKCHINVGQIIGFDQSVFNDKKNCNTGQKKQKNRMHMKAQIHDQKKEDGAHMEQRGDNHGFVGPYF